MSYLLRDILTQSLIEKEGSDQQALRLNFDPPLCPSWRILGTIQKPKLSSASLKFYHTHVEGGWPCTDRKPVTWLVHPSPVFSVIHEARGEIKPWTWLLVLYSKGEPRL